MRSGVAYTGNHRCLAGARGPNEDHVCICQDVSGLLSFFLCCDDDGFEVLENLLYMLHVVKFAEGVLGILRIHLVSEEIFGGSRQTTSAVHPHKLV